MQFNFRKAIVANPDAMLHAVTGMTYLMAFVLGMGRYRVILFYSFFSVVKAIFTYYGTSLQFLYFIFLPVLILLGYWDISYGQLYPLFPKISFIASILMVFLFDTVIRSIVKTNIQDLTGNKIFIICPNCKLSTKSFVSKCEYCGYQTGDIVSKPPQFVNNLPCLSQDIILEIDQHKTLGLYRRVSEKILGFINLSENERVLINLRLFPFRSMTKNGEKRVISRMIITTERIIFIDYLFFGNGWLYKDEIAFDQIRGMRLEEKQVNIKKAPILVISDNSGSEFEVFLSSFPSVREKLTAIMDCVKKRNVEIDHAPK